MNWTRPLFIFFTACALAAHLSAAGLGPAKHEQLKPNSGVRLEGFPAASQLVPRGVDGLGRIAIRGEVEDSQIRELRLTVWANGELLTLRTASLDRVLGHTSFSFEESLPAGLIRYRFQLDAFDGIVWSRVRDRDDVVVGDVYLVQGQSNAVATDYQFEGLANQNQRGWIRSFGTASTEAAETRADLGWYVADGLGQNGKGTIGAWALKAARLLSEEYEVPIAILNGAVGGTAIRYHFRNDDAPGDLETNYGRLLYRSEMAGLRDAARAMIWYQGEWDRNEAERWGRDFGDLYDDWLSDYAGLEQIYVFQLRSSCGFATNAMQDTQRRLPEFYPLVQVMSTSAAPGHDGCHFFFAGYDELGDRIARLLARDFYGSPVVQNVDPPRIESAVFSSAERDQIVLTFEDADDQLFVESGVEADFVVNDGVEVVRAEVDGNRVVLDLAEPSGATKVDYRSRSGDGPRFANALGVGALTFSVAIED